MNNDRGFFDKLIEFVNGFVGAPNVRDGEKSVQQFYDGTLPAWNRSERKSATQLLQVTNGLDVKGTPVTTSTDPANFRGSVLSGTKKGWSAGGK